MNKDAMSARALTGITRGLSRSWNVDMRFGGRDFAEAELALQEELLKDGGR
jgi:hypothetical protein